MEDKEEKKDYINDDNKEINDEQQEGNLEIEQLNEKMNPVSASSEEKDFIESKKALKESIDSSQESTSSQKEGQKEDKQQTDTQQETTAAFGSLFALPKIIEIPLLKARMNYDWDMQDEQLMNEGISAMAKKYGADGKMLPPEVIYGIGITLPPAKAYIINKINEFLLKRKQEQEKKNPQSVSQETNPVDIAKQMEQAKQGGLNG